ncbi:hypothetical protein [Desulfovibrio sp. QI0434]
MCNKTTKLLKHNIFQAYNKGISYKEIADKHCIGVASVSATTTDDAVQAVTGKTYMSAHFGR